MIYLDTSAAVKALIEEEQSEAIRDLLDSEQRFVSSRLFALELAAVTERRNADRDKSARLLQRVALVSLDDAVVDQAVVARSGLRALDALHLATALQLEGAVDSMLSFDSELVDKAREAGIPPHPLVAAGPVD